jgi:hypothetical protein
MASAVSAAISFAFVPFTPLEGFFLWIAGVTVLVGSDFSGAVRDIIRRIRVRSKSSIPEANEN